MIIIDSGHITDLTIHTDICIIGAGPAGLTIARRLHGHGLDVVIAESGGTGSDFEANELNALQIDSNFRYRNNTSRRARQVGGSAGLWAGRLVPFDFNQALDREWGNLPASVRPYYDEAFRQLNLDPAIRSLTNDDAVNTSSRNELHGYWALKTCRFTARSLLTDRTPNALSKNPAEKCRLYTYLAFTGDATFNGARITSLDFQNRNHQHIRIIADKYIFAMGGIENSRMLLVMEEHVKPRMGKTFYNVGRYIMDHPRVFHGTVKRPADRMELNRYQMKASTYGFYKTGIRKAGGTSRVYANLIGSPGPITRRMLMIPWKAFQVSSKKLLLKETDLIRTLSSQLLVISRENSARIKGRINDFINRKIHDIYKVMTYCEQLPRPENRITTGRLTDRNQSGLPVINNNIHTDELKEVLDFYTVLEKHLSSLGCNLRYSREYILDAANYTDASHITGGTRYSADRSRAVVDESFRVNGIPNLHVAGSSVFPTSGVENPTHLIVALCLYIADKMIKTRD
jgi:choline dehydrogenase-like flavoprotein